MAIISVYDVTPVDKAQLAAAWADRGHDVRYISEPLSEANAQADAEVLVVFVSSVVSQAVMAKLPKLKLIACRATGFNNVDLRAAAERGVRVVNVPSYGEHTVAEYTFGLILMLARKLREAAAMADAEEFDQAKLQGVDLAGKTLGIVGTGRIGQCVARVALAFEMSVVGFDPFPNEARAKELGYSYVSLEALAQQSDILSLHSPYTGDNRHLVNEALLAEMKPSALLINTARGELVDTKALVKALEGQQLGGAALDVLEREELLKLDEELLLLRGEAATPERLAAGVEIDVLKRLPNVILSPHNAFNTSEAVGRINQTTASNIEQFLAGAIRNEVKPGPVKPGRLLLVRHGESTYNAEGKWTGSRDVHLSEKGFHEAALLGQAIRDVTVGYAFCSKQVRAFETMEGMLDTLQQFDVPYERSSALNERDYGDYTGVNKWEVRDRLGEEVFNGLRRGWDYPVPNGETLKMVYQRAVPYYKEKIVPKLLEGKTVLVTSHGNVIRAIMKYIEDLSDEAVGNLEMPFGEIIQYSVDTDGRMVSKEERKIATTPPPA